MVKHNISWKQLEVLCWIAKNGPATEYELTKHAGEIKVSSFTAHQAPNRLAEKGLLKAEPRGKARTGKTIKVYGLTVEGFLEVLKEKQAWANIDKIISSNEQLLPGYFGLWKKFIEMKVDDVAVKLLAYVVERLQKGIPTFPEKIEGRKPTLKDWLPRLAIYPYDAMLDGVLSQEEVLRFHRVILGDDRAEKLYVDTLKWIIDSHKSAMESFSAALEKHHEVKYWFEKARRVVEIIENIREPAELLKALKRDKDLWQALLRLYPEVKDEKGFFALFEKLRIERMKADVEG